MNSSGFNGIVIWMHQHASCIGTSAEQLLHFLYLFFTVFLSAVDLGVPICTCILMYGSCIISFHLNCQFRRKERIIDILLLC